MTRSLARMTLLTGLVAALSTITSVAQQKPGVSASAKAPATARQTAQAGTRIVVGPNIRVSTAHGDWAHYEIVLAADPVDSKRLLGCSMVSTGERNQTWTIVYLSTDGGQSWTPTRLDDSSTYSVDPACGFGLNGAAYFLSLPAASDIPGEVKRMLLFRSGDGGKTWTSPLELHSSDREYIAVDMTGGQHHGNVYVHANIRDGKNRVFALFRSVDAGASFAPLVPQPAEQGYTGNGTGNSVVLSDGTWLATTRELAVSPSQGASAGAKSSDRLSLRWSSDGGKTLGPAVIISDWPGCPASANANRQAALAVDGTNGPFRDRVYVTWPDFRSGHCEVLFASSSDKGQTWSRPVVINDEVPSDDPAIAPNHLMPVVAVNNAGVLGISWYDRRDNPDNHGWWVRFRASLDGGETFLPSVRVSSAPYAPTPADGVAVMTLINGGGVLAPRTPGGLLKTSVSPAPVGYYNGGDTGGMAAAADGVFHTFWVDNRTGVQQLWTAPVTVHGEASLNGASDLAALDDVTALIALEVSRTHYDPLTKTTTLTVALTNTSKKTVTGPLKVRVMSLTSVNGAPRVVGADNGEVSAGAVWDFTRLLVDNRIRPRETTKARTLVIQMTEVDAGRAARRFNHPAVFNFDSKVLGKSQ